MPAEADGRLSRLECVGLVPIPDSTVPEPRLVQQLAYYKANYTGMQQSTGTVATGEELVTSYKNSIPNYVVLDGVPFPGSLITKHFSNIKTFHVREDDIVIAGYPRSGNHWMKEIVTLVCAEEPIRKLPLESPTKTPVTPTTPPTTPTTTTTPSAPPTPTAPTMVVDEKFVYERIPLLEFSVDLKICMQTYMDNYFQKFGPAKSVFSKVATKFGLISSEKLFSQAYLDPLTALESRPSPRIYHTHLTFRQLPEEAKTDKCKMIYLMRNGKDVAVSFYEMHKMYPPFGYYSGDWKEFFYTYLSGKVCFGSWFDHVQDWWSRKEQKNVLYVTYEDMIENLSREVKRVADFLERDLDLARIDDIVSHCTFKSMKENPNATYDGLHSSIDTRKTSFLRKGKVADWKSRMTVEDSEFFDCLYRQYFKDDGPDVRFELNNGNY